MGTFTLEVMGSEGKAIFSASGTAPCSMGGTCFNRGILTVDGEEIAVHSSGVSLKEFNRPENQIVVLTKKIQFYNRKYPESKNDPSKSNSSVLGLWVERAEAYAKIKQYEKAVSDIEVAISLFEQENPSLDRIFKTQDLKKYMTLAALYHYFLENYSQSAEAIERAIGANDIYMEARKKDSAATINVNKQVDRLDLWLWIVRMKQGKQELADRELRHVLEEASKSDRFCELNIKIARFYVGDMNEKHLADSIDNNPRQIARHCNGFIASIKFSSNYYIGQKAIVNGNIEKGKAMLRLSLENRGGYNKEREIAIYELDN